MSNNPSTRSSQATVGVAIMAAGCLAFLVPTPVTSGYRIYNSQFQSLKAGFSFDPWRILWIIDALLTFAVIPLALVAIIVTLMRGRNPLLYVVAGVAAIEIPLITLIVLNIFNFNPMEAELSFWGRIALVLLIYAVIATGAAMAAFSKPREMGK